MGFMYVGFWEHLLAIINVRWGYEYPVPGAAPARAGDHGDARLGDL
jgi:hypothetical protein